MILFRDFPTLCQCAIFGPNALFFGLKPSFLTTFYTQYFLSFILPNFLSTPREKLQRYVETKNVTPRKFAKKRRFNGTVFCSIQDFLPAKEKNHKSEKISRLQNEQLGITLVLFKLLLFVLIICDHGGQKNVYMMNECPFEFGLMCSALKQKNHNLEKPFNFLPYFLHFYGKTQCIIMPAGKTD